MSLSSFCKNSPEEYLQNSLGLSTGIFVKFLKRVFCKILKRSSYENPLDLFKGIFMKIDNVGVLLNFIFHENPLEEVL